MTCPRSGHLLCVLLSAALFVCFYGCGAAPAAESETAITPEASVAGDSLDAEPQASPAESPQTTEAASQPAGFDWKPADGAIQISQEDPTGAVLVDSDLCTVSVSRIVPHSEDAYGNALFEYDLSCVNNSDVRLTFYISGVSVNGYCLSVGNSVDAEAGETSALCVWEYDSSLGSAASDFDAIRVLEFSLNVYESYSGPNIAYDQGADSEYGKCMPVDIVIYPHGDTAETVGLSARAPSEGELTLADNDSFTFTVTGFGAESALGFSANIYVENKTDGPLIFEVGDTLLDGNLCSPNSGGSVTIPGHRRAEYDVTWFIDGDGSRVTRAGKLEFLLAVKNAVTGAAAEGFSGTSFEVAPW